MCFLVFQLAFVDVRFANSCVFIYLFFLWFLVFLDRKELTCRCRAGTPCLPVAKPCTSSQPQNPVYLVVGFPGGWMVDFTWTADAILISLYFLFSLKG